MDRILPINTMPIFLLLLSVCNAMEQENFTKGDNVTFVLASECVRHRNDNSSEVKLRQGKLTAYFVSCLEINGQSYRREDFEAIAFAPPEGREISQEVAVKQIEMAKTMAALITNPSPELTQFLTAWIDYQEAQRYRELLENILENKSVIQWPEFNACTKKVKPILKDLPKEISEKAIKRLSDVLVYYAVKEKINYADYEKELVLLDDQEKESIKDRIKYEWQVANTKEFINRSLSVEDLVQAANQSAEISRTWLGNEDQILFYKQLAQLINRLEKKHADLELLQNRSKELRLKVEHYTSQK